MAMTEAVASGPDTEAEGLAFARDVLRAEADALDLVRGRLDGAIVRAAELVRRCRGGVAVAGMGKAGLVGHKVAATLASTGTRAYPLHPADALHGDLGRVGRGDVVIALSQSGETEEVVRLVPAVKALGASVVAITGRRGNSLGRLADVCIALGPIEEACPLGLAPSASTTAMMAVGDALALLVSRMRGFGPEDFARFHPGGSLGRKLGRVEDLMRTGAHIRIAREEESVRAIFVRLAGPKRRAGAVIVVDAEGRLSGIFTDGDLARLFEGRREAMLDRPIAEVMTRDPVRVGVGLGVAEAVEALRARKISELPVVDPAGRPVGMIDLTDLTDLVPVEFEVEAVDEPVLLAMPGAEG